MCNKSLFIIALILLVAFTVQAQVPRLINYQGMLTDASDNPVTGTRNIQFAIYSQAAGGSALWTETQSNVQITDGIFNIILGSSTAIPYTVFDGTNKYLGLKVGSDAEMTPRKQLVSVGYAFRAYDADKVDGQELSSNDGTVNQSSDPVSWTKIKDIPAGFADGTDEGGTGGDNLGNHSATQNIRLNGYYLSNDGGNEGISIDNSGTVTVTGGYIKTGTPTQSASAGDIVATANVKADNEVRAGGDIISNVGNIRTGTPSSIINSGDIVADENLKADMSIVSRNGAIYTGTPTSTYSAGDIVATNNLIADNWLAANAIHTQGDIFTDNGWIRTGTPTSNFDAGDIAADDDLLADDECRVGNDLIVYDHACINYTSVRPEYQLYVSGSAYATGVWNSSDIKFKQNINDIKTPLDKVNRLRGVNYEWKTDAYPEKEFPTGKQFGLIAQEVEKIFPEIVKEDESGEKAIAYFELIPILIEAIKQQQATITELQDKMNELMNK